MDAAYLGGDAAGSPIRYCIHAAPMVEAYPMNPTCGIAMEQQKHKVLSVPQARQDPFPLLVARHLSRLQNKPGRI